MDVDTLLTASRDQTHVTSSQVSDAQLLRYINAVYHDAIAAITEYVGEDFFYEIWTTAAVVSQVNGEYAFPEQDSSNAGMSKLKALELLINSTDTFFTKARQVDIRFLAHTWDWYLTNHSGSDPIYYIADRSVFIAPNFTSAMVPNASNSQVKLHGIKQAVDLASGNGEAAILVPREYHLSVLATGAKQYIFSQHGKLKDKNDAKAEYRANKEDMISYLSDRDQSIGIASLPSERDLE